MSDPSKSFSGHDFTMDNLDPRTRKARVLKAALEAGVRNDDIALLVADLSRMVSDATALASGSDLASRLETVLDRVGSYRGPLSFKELRDLNLIRLMMRTSHSVRARRLSNWRVAKAIFSSSMRP